MKKQELRKKMIAEIRRAEKPSASYVASVISDLEEFKKASTIFSYVALPSEVDLSVLIDKAIAEGKAVGFPALECGLFGVATSSWRQKLTLAPDKTSILREGEACLNIENTEGKVLLLVPGLAFSKSGKRLGRGAGFYDRLFERTKLNPNITSIGICRACQVLEEEEIPFEDNDQCVDKVLSF